MALIGPKILWHSLPAEEVATVLDADFKVGLEMETVLKRRAKYGKNALKKPPRESFFKKIFNCSQTAWRARNTLLAVKQTPTLLIKRLKLPTFQEKTPQKQCFFRK